MWDRLAQQIQIERHQVWRLLNKHRPLLEACTRRAPDDIELSALAAMLHSYYNGVENILKRIAMETGGPGLRNDSWHKSLLDSMAKPTERRSAVLSTDLHARMQEYLECGATAPKVLAAPPPHERGSWGPRPFGRCGRASLAGEGCPPCSGHLRVAAIRHVFRHAYVFDPRWAKMAHLVLECEQTLQQFETEIDRFMQSDRPENRESR